MTADHNDPARDYRVLRLDLERGEDGRAPRVEFVTPRGRIVLVFANVESARKVAALFLDVTHAGAGWIPG